MSAAAENPSTRNAAETGPLPAKFALPPYVKSATYEPGASTGAPSVTVKAPLLAANVPDSDFTTPAASRMSTDSVPAGGTGNTEGLPTRVTFPDNAVVPLNGVKN